MSLRRVLVPLLVVAFGGGCGSGLPRPPTGPHSPDAFIEVPYPPPPARVETVPEKPDDKAVWIDGQWTWLGRRYLWQPGGWLIPEPNTYFAPWTIERRASGQLVFAPGEWRTREGGEAQAPAFLAPAAGQTRRGPRRP